MSKEKHALFLAGGSKAITGNSDSRRNNNERFHTRINRRELQAGSVSGIRELVRQAYRSFTRANGIGDSEKPLPLVDGSLLNGHAGGVNCRNLLQRGSVRNRKLEIALGSKVCLGRLRGILDNVLFRANEFVVARLKDD